MFSQWQDRALSGILEALEPRGTREGMEGPVLPMQIKRLLDRKVRTRELETLGRSAHWRGRQEDQAAVGLPLLDGDPDAGVYSVCRLNSEYQASDL